MFAAEVNGSGARKRLMSATAFVIHQIVTHLCMILNQLSQVMIRMRSKRSFGQGMMPHMIMVADDL